MYNRSLRVQGPIWDYLGIYYYFLHTMNQFAINVGRRHRHGSLGNSCHVIRVVNKLTLLQQSHAIGVACLCLLTTDC